ncbi:MAG TPA: PilZ domain-containing protein [Bryobacteraceae bacterium]|nr:PilZ domain-containing protein [Bryobacteraceae bacterium]
MAKDTIRGDRRLQRRYPIELDLEFRIMDGDQVVSTGAGRTGNISSGGVLFHAAEDVPSATHVEIAVRWPAVLGNTPFLELRISGRLVRNDSQGVAMRMNRYHFEKLSNPRGAFEEIFTSAVIQ